MITNDKYRFVLRKFTGGNIENFAIEFQNNICIEDTYGATKIILPGGTATYSFDIDEEKYIGLGIKTDRDIVNCSLFNEYFQFLNYGHHQLNKLKKGRYFIEIRCPSESESPVTVTPVIIGRYANNDFIPLDYLKKIIDGNDF